MKTKVIRQGDLTSDCWNIQFWGLDACQSCEYKDTEECGGKAIIKKIKDQTYPQTGLPDTRANEC